MLWIRCALALLCATYAAGCLEDGGGLQTVGGCGPSGTCQTSDCYASCYCQTGATAECERRCGQRGVRVQDLDESAWLAEWIALEDEVIALTNAQRAQGGCCDDANCFDPAPPLALDTQLRSAARAHASDMAERRYFEHEAPDGRSPFDRMREARFRGCTMGENIAAGQSMPQQAIEAWRASPGHCANMLSPLFDRIGVGYLPAPELTTPHFWVQNFGG